MIRISLRCDFQAVLPKLKDKLEKSGFLLVEDEEDAALFVPQIARRGWEREILACTARGGAVVIVKKENVSAAEELLKGSGAAVLSAEVPFSVLAGALQAEAKAGERLFAVCEELCRLREKLESEKLIMRAKLVLMERGMTEREAHRLLEKQAMDRRLPRRAVAEEILNAEKPQDHQGEGG